MTEKSLIDRTSVIIRSAGERTEQLCRKLIIEQGVSPENLVAIKEVPFSAALKKSFQAGIERGLKWTLCNDADVLLRPGAVETIAAIRAAGRRTIFLSNNPTKTREQYAAKLGYGGHPKNLAQWGANTALDALRQKL